MSRAKAPTTKKEIFNVSASFLMARSASTVR